MGLWNGSHAIPDGAVNGGSGTWNSTSTNWTLANGTLNRTWSSDFAVFQGTAGTVTVEGAQSFTGMQFVTDGYQLQTGAAGTLTAVNGASGSATVRVDPNVTATLGVPARALRSSPPKKVPALTTAQARPSRWPPAMLAVM